MSPRKSEVTKRFKNLTYDRWVKEARDYLDSLQASGSIDENLYKQTDIAIMRFATNFLALFPVKSLISMSRIDLALSSRLFTRMKNVRRAS